MKQMQGADILIQSLIEHGVEVIFGYPGGANLPIYDSLGPTTGCGIFWCVTSRGRPTWPMPIPGSRES